MNPALLQFVVSGIANGAIYALVALGFALIYNATGIINFAQGEFVMLGGMMGVWLFNVLGAPLPAALAGAVATVALVAVLLERAAIDHVRDSPPVTRIVITIGASMLLKGGAMVLWGKDPLTMPPISGDNPIIFAGAAVVPQQLWILAGLAAVVAFMAFLYRFTWLGKGMRASEANPVAARLMGISPSHMTLMAFALSGAFAALAGVLITPRTMVVFDQGGVLGLKGFAGAVVGGLGNPMGAVIGGVSLGVLESLAVSVLPSGYKDAVAFVVLLAVLFIRPQGILGSHRERV